MIDINILITAVITLIINSFVILLIAYFAGKAFARGIYKALQTEMPIWIKEITTELQKMRTLERAIQSKTR